VLASGRSTPLPAGYAHHNETRNVYSVDLNGYAGCDDYEHITECYAGYVGCEHADYAGSLCSTDSRYFIDMKYYVGCDSCKHGNECCASYAGYNHGGEVVPIWPAYLDGYPYVYTYDFAIYTGYEHGNDAGLNDAGSVCDVYYESYDIVFGGCDGYAYKNESCENHAVYEHGCDARQGYFDTSGEGYALVGYMYGYAGCAGYEDGYENMYTGYEQGNGAGSVCYVYCGSYDIVFGGCDGYAHKNESCENYAGYEHGYDARQGYFDTSCDGFAHRNG
jgi:hypothetical protein